MRQSSTAQPPPWVEFAVTRRSQEDLPFPQLARLIRDEHGVELKWHQVRNAVNRHQREARLHPPPLLPWVLPRDETDAYVAPRLRLVVAQHRGHTLSGREEKWVQSLQLYMERLGRAEVIRWDGVSWEMRRRRDTDEVFDPTWFPPLIVK